jgi:serine/threonine-protein kinase
MSEKKFQRFGKYLILDHLVDGGMAKICRALQLGEQNNRIVAIKMVQPQFSNDEAFVRMFKDELRVTFDMGHPNIMKVFDSGITNDQLFTAMEYIHGANLKQYLDRLKEKKVVFPVDTSVYIISQVCQGLHYAHTFTDKLTGQPYNLVHRDISPHNIMITYSGDVKVIDFGIAKANTNSEATQAGTIKGKMSYLAPEYLDGLELDARYDEFAVGITLWEMLCSRKLFQAPNNNDLAILKQVQACKIKPPSEINPKVPKELDRIVMKALSKDRSHRYENLDQMNRDLVKFLYAEYPDFNASDLKTFADDLFKAEIERDREKFVEYGRIDVQSYLEEMRQEEATKTSKESKRTEKTSGSLERKQVREFDLSMESSGPQIEIEHTSTNLTDTKKLPKSTLQPASKAPAKQVKTSSGQTSMDKTSSRVVNKKEIGNARESSSKTIVIFIIAASIAVISYFQPIMGFSIKSFLGEEDSQVRDVASVQQDQGATSNSRRINPALVQGELILSGVDISMEVYLNGQKTDYVGSPLPVPLDKEVTVLVKKVGHIPFIKKISLSKDSASVVISIPEMELARVGLLTTSMNYPAGSKLVYDELGEKFEKDLPLKDMPITQGTYQAKILNPILGTEKNVEFTIEENKKHFLE